MKQIQSQYNIQFTTYHLVVVEVIATTVLESRLLQAGQQSGLPLGAVAHNSGAARATRARVASCDDVVVTVGYLNTTSISAMKYQLIEVNQQQQQLVSILGFCINFCLLCVIS